MTAIQNRVKFLNHKYSKQKIKIHKHSWRFGSDANWLFGLSILAYNCLKFSHSWNWHLRLIFTFMCLTKIWEKLQISFILLLFVFHLEQKREKKCLPNVKKKKFTNLLYVIIRGSFGTNQLLRIIYGCLILFHHWDQTKVNSRGQFHKYEHFRELQGKFEILGGQFAIDPNPKRCLCISAKVK